MIRMLLAITAILLFFSTNAKALTICNDRGCYENTSKAAAKSVKRVARVVPRHARVKSARTVPVIARTGGQASVARGGLVTVATAADSVSRPRDCYGIAWCGCWLRHVLGIPDRSLNLAANWSKVGQPATPETANIVVWAHHVGRKLDYKNGKILLQSGNDGGAVRTRWVSPSIRGPVIAYRRV